MNDRINELIPKAIKAVDEKIAYKHMVAKEYKGYINGLGPGILQVGLIATLAFCTDRKKGIKDTDRNNVMNALLYMQEPEADRDMHLLKYVITKCLKHNEQSYEQKNRLAIVDLDQNKLEEMEEIILEMVIALKLAIRTFKLSDTDETPEL